MKRIEDMDEEELQQELESVGLETEESSDYGSPSSPKKDSTLKFFRELIHQDESTKFGNLKDKELGLVTLTPRDLFEIAQYADAERLDELAQYFRDRAEMIFATSLSKDGFLAQLFVTQIKKEKKEGSRKETKKGLFGNKEVEKNE